MKEQSWNKQLKRCPFCNGLAWGVENPTILKGGGYRIECQREGVCCAKSTWWHTKEQAVKAWNRRYDK